VKKMRKKVLIRRKFLFFLGIIISAIVVIAGCIFYLKWKTTNSSQEKFYSVSSLVDYDNSLCASTGYSYQPGGFNSGIKLALKDKKTGKSISGSAGISNNQSSGGIDTTEYSCDEGITSENAIVSAYSKGYAPLVFLFQYPKNQLAEVEVLMVKSCSGGPSYFDNLKLYAERIGNKTAADEFIKEHQDNVYETIKTVFGFEKTDYALKCIESNPGRGGYIKAKGAYKGGSAFELYYRLGWCSSGGSDCGSKICFSSKSDALFSSVKNMSCRHLSSRQLGESNGQSILISDQTEEVRNNCTSGAFEKEENGKKILSIIQNAGRYTESVEVGGFNCLEN
jgi:hypothetical protein